MNRQGYIHLAILNIFHLFKDVEENIHTMKQEMKEINKPNMNF